jgi:small subunit ribosomal protein S15
MATKTPKVKKTTEKKVAPKPTSAKATVGKKAPKKIKETVVPAPSEEKLEVIAKFQVKAGDTGSPEVQVALLTARIEKLVGHLKANPSDNHSRRGLLGIVSKRRRLLNYLNKKDSKRYKDIAAKLGLGK